MAYMWASGYCFSCGNVFNFNPDIVPSIRARDGKPDPTAPRQPVCRTCVERANPARIKNGLPPIDILPGAYDAQEVV